MSDDKAGPTDRPLPISIETALPVEDITQEYQWVATFTCVCGYWGNLEVQRQVLIQGEDGRHYDLLETRCTACGKDYGFYFDVTKVFESYAKVFGASQDETAGGDNGRQAGD